MQQRFSSHRTKALFAAKEELDTEMQFQLTDETTDGTGIHWFSSRGARHPVVCHSPKFTKTQTAAVVGVIPLMLDLNDPRGAVEQMNEKYVFGGWRPMEGFRMDERHSLTYPSDPPMEFRAMMEFRDERVFVYDYAWVCVLQKDGTFEAARLD